METKNKLEKFIDGLTYKKLKCLIDKIDRYDNSEDALCLVNILKEELDSRPRQTLREFINDNKSGAYVGFNFTIENVKVENICSVNEFSRTYNEKLLDKYSVVASKYVHDGGNNCENYHATYYLEVVKNEKDND